MLLSWIFQTAAEGGHALIIPGYNRSLVWRIEIYFYKCTFLNCDVIIRLLTNRSWSFCAAELNTAWRCTRGWQTPRRPRSATLRLKLSTFSFRSVYFAISQRRCHKKVLKCNLFRNIRRTICYFCFCYSSAATDNKVILNTNEKSETKKPTQVSWKKEKKHEEGSVT